MLTPKQIKNYDFQLVARGAYKSSDVDAFMNEVYQSYSQMFDENAELIKKMNLLADKVAHYKEDEESIREALVEAQKMKNNILQEAEAEARARVLLAEKQAQANLDSLNKDAANILSDAHQEADGIIETAEQTLNMAKKNAASLLERAEEMYQEKVGSIESDAIQQQKKMESIQEESERLRQKLIDTYKNQLEMLEFSQNFDNPASIIPTANDFTPDFEVPEPYQAPSVSDVTDFFSNTPEEPILEAVEEAVKEAPTEVVEETVEEAAKAVFEEPEEEPARKSSKYDIFLSPFKREKSRAEKAAEQDYLEKDYADIYDYLDDEEE